MKTWFFVILLLLVGHIAGAEKFVVSSPRQVEDVILRQSVVTYENEDYWSGWNFGASQTLDIGYGIAMWNMWKGNVLVRFDLRGVDCRKVERAVFRIYKPRNVTQMAPEIQIGVYAVSPANRGWVEGRMESLPQADASSWKFIRDGREWAGGSCGCSVAGVDFDSAALGMAVACKYVGEWLEFSLPAGLVQGWLDKPAENAGLLIKVAGEEPRMGDHVLFYSSEHATGKGPQLVIEGAPGKALVKADNKKAFNPRYVMPSQGSAFQKYLKEKDFRYTYWTTDTVVNLQGEQKIYPYYWDVVVDGEYVLPDAYYPLSRSVLGLDSLIARKDAEGLKTFQKNRLRYLHLWEYVREQRWYDCGDVIEIFSPYQAALIWLGSKKDNGLSFNGVLNKVHPKGCKNLTQRDMQERRLDEVMECVRNMVMTEEQYNAVEGFISGQENLRCIYFNKCNEAAQRVHQLLAEKNNGNEMIDALGEFMNYHDVYLFYDSYWQMQRWAFLMDHTDPVQFNLFWKKQKFNEYAPVRQQKRFEECARYWPEDRKPLKVEIRNKF